MACTANKTPLLRAIATRGFSAQASPKAASSKVNELQVTSLPNKLVVASIDGNSPLSHVYRAGSRHEAYEKQGITHLLRVGASLSNNNSSGFGVRVNVKATGGDLSVLSDRESIAYNVELKRDELATGLKYLQDVPTQQSFRPWEIRDISYRIKDDLARVPLIARAVDLLHQAAFYRGLGNSVFCAKRNVGNISPEDLQSYVANNFSADRATERKSENPQEVADIFADYFEGLYTKDEEPLVFDEEYGVEADDTWEVELTMGDIENAIEKLDPKSTSGPDDIALLFVKKCMDALVWPLWILHQKSMELGKIPSKLKISKVVPVYNRVCRFQFLFLVIPDSALPRCTLALAIIISEKFFFISQYKLAPSLFQKFSSYMR